MKRIIITAIALFAVTILFDSSAQAQGINYGSRGFLNPGRTAGLNVFRGANLNRRGINSFGLGGYGFGGNFISAFSNTVRPERQPFFATNPPVYYSGIVKRPYGISPYAVPAGTVPVEMTVGQPEPVTIANPFFNEAVPASDVKTEEPQETENKTTMIVNPYFESEPVVIVDAEEVSVDFASLETVVEEN
jgi:hypothetical protein